MRLSLLLDTNTQGDLRPTARIGAPYETSRPAVPEQGPHGDEASTTDVLGALSVSTDHAEFDRLMAGLLPCRVEDSELWFAEKQSEVEKAKALCRQCPLIAGCLAGAIDRAEPWGVWGGEVFVDGKVVATKRGRGRPRKVRPEESVA